MKSKAVIWDMDGVIADTGEKHFQSWQTVFSRRGIDFTEKQFRHNFGQRNDNIIQTVLGVSVPPEEMDTIAREKEMNFRTRIGADLKPFPGAIPLMASLKEHGFRMAVASSGPRQNIELIVRTLGIGGYLEVIVAGRDVSESKPSPQIFLLAAEKLGVAPACSVVIEDSTAGVTAAKRGGMYCLAVATTHPRESLSEADLVVDTLEAVTAADLDKMLDCSCR